ncbi:hypothetical protein B566_EDAN011453 [Ephemera danica]|nr:hypothetical protein B566_EDAN011453 [Ephemera danica]
MDPGPWAPYTYNGLSAPGVASASGSLASAAGQRAMADFQAMGSQPGASQLLQLAGMSPAAAVAAAANAAANSASFLSSNYEPVFTSLFHHSAQKSQYGALNVAHHRQPLVKPGDSELTAALRDNYMHQSVATSTAALYEQTSPLNWSQASTSLGSPFGVLPHESVSGSSKSSSPDKKGHMFSDGSTPPYENTFSAHLSPPFAHGYTNSQLAAAAEFRNSSNPTNFDSKKVQKSIAHDSKASASSTSWQGAFSQVTPTSARDCSSLPPPPATSFAPSHAQKVQVAANFVSRAAAVAAASTVAVAAATAHQQQASPQTCIVSRPGHHQVPPNLPFVPQHRPSSVPAPMVQEKTAPRSVGFSSKAAPTSSHVPTKAQSKGFPSGPLDASVNSTVPHESSQSPRYGLDANHNFSSSASAAAVASASKAPCIPQAHQRVPYPNPTAAHMAQYRNFPSPDAGGPVSHATEYQRSTPDSIALSPYSDSEPQHCHTQNGGSSSSSGMGRPSPTQNSPLSHTPSPAYPIYNSPMSAPSPHHETPSCVYSKPAPSQTSSGYPSVIQCNSAPSEVKHVARQNFPPSIKQSWEMHEKLVRGVRDMSQSNAGAAVRFAYATESVDVMDEGMLAGSEGLPQHRQAMYEAASTINMHDLQGPSSEELLARGATEAEVDEYDRRRGRKVKRRKSDEKSKPPVQNCGYPTIQNGYFPTAYHENLMARNSLGGYHPRLGFNPAHMHGQPTPAHTQCGSNPPIYHQMGPLPLSMQQQQQGPSTSTVSPSQHVPPEKPPLPGPSVEDELAFLEDPVQVVTPQPTSSQVQRPGTSKDSTGFMDSYMKFLRGETETPLTISVRAGRKSPKVADPPRRNSAAARATAARNQVSKAAAAATASPSVASTPPSSSADKPCLPYQQQQPHVTSEESKKQDCVPVMLAAHVRQQADMSSCLLEDKRTPKEACLQPSVLTNPEVRSRFDVKARDEINLQQSRGRPTKRSAPVQEELPEELPKRKPARRKAKQEAALRRQFAELSDDEEPADTDSDSDPVWTPPIDEVNKVASAPKRGWSRRGRHARFSLPKENSSPKKKPGRRPKTYESDEEASSRDANDSNSDTESEIRKTKRACKLRYPNKDRNRTESTDSEVTSSKDVAVAKKPRIDESRRKRFVVNLADSFDDTSQR